MVNLLWCVIDCLRYDALSLNGYERETTPFLDRRLSRDFVAFRNCYTQSSFTVASASSMFTGTYPSTHGALGFNDRLPRGINTLGDYLSGEGSQVEVFSGMNFFSEEWGLDRSFNVNKVKADDTGIGQPRADKLVEAFESSIDSSKEFSAILWFFDLHTPWLSEPDFEGGNKKRDAYDTELRFVDKQLGKLMKFLQEEGVYDETLIILTSDHGDLFDEHHRMEGNPLADFLVKSSVPGLSKVFEGNGYLGHLSYPLYNELLNVPLYLKLPNQKLGGTEIDGQMELIDVLPTVLSCMDVDIDKEDRHWQGKDISSELDGYEGKNYVYAEAKPRAELGRYMSVQGKDYKLIRFRPPSLSLDAVKKWPKVFFAEKFLAKRTNLFKANSAERVDYSPEELDTLNELKSKLLDYVSKNEKQSEKFGREQYGEISKEAKDELKELGYL